MFYRFLRQRSNQMESIRTLKQPPEQTVSCTLSTQPSFSSGICQEGSFIHAHRDIRWHPLLVIMPCKTLGAGFIRHFSAPVSPSLSDVDHLSRTRVWSPCFCRSCNAPNLSDEPFLSVNIYIRSLLCVNFCTFYLHQFHCPFKSWSQTISKFW